MEFKIIFYIIVGIGWFLYKSYEKAQEQFAKRKEQTSPSYNPTTPSVTPPTKSALEQIVEKYKQPVAPAANNSRIVTTLQTTAKNIEPNEIEESRKKAADIAYNETEEGASFVLNPREAFISSLIFERKY